MAFRCHLRKDIFPAQEKMLIQSTEDLQVICTGKSKTMRLLRKAILAGHATKMARRMPQHNGYKTVGPRGTLAQLHPSCATLTSDEDGMLPQWLVYHELMQTARTFISKASYSPKRQASSLCKPGHSEAILYRGLA